MVIRKKQQSGRNHKRGWFHPSCQWETHMTGFIASSSSVTSSGTPIGPPVFAWKGSTRRKQSEVAPCLMKEQKSSRMMPTLLIGLLLSSLLLRAETWGAGRGEDGREVENRWKWWAPRQVHFESYFSTALSSVLDYGTEVSCVLESFDFHSAGQFFPVCSCFPNHWCLKLSGMLDMSIRVLL